MGLQCAKSLLPVRRHKARQMRFLDIILGQVAHRAHEAERASAGHVHELVPHFG